jgi:hypothetical protein
LYMQCISPVSLVYVCVTSILKPLLVIILTKKCQDKNHICLFSSKCSNALVRRFLWIMENAIVFQITGNFHVR